jgi:phosphatidylserine/phosphatidylglycerophosphate/cardiolipin synthase-like enzyme
MKSKKLILKLNLIFFLPVCLIFALPGKSVSQMQSLFQLVESIPLETQLGSAETARTLDVWLDMIDAARNSIDMEFFYLSPKTGETLDQVIRSLERAATRGVKIRMIADARMASTYPEILDSLNKHQNIDIRKISFYNRKNGVMHAKYFLVDDEQLFLGSQNMDWRALSHIHELGVRIYHPALTRNLKVVFETDWKLAEYSDGELPPEISAIPANPSFNRDQPAMLPLNSQDTIRLYPTASYPEVTPSGISHDETEITRLIESAREKIEIQLLSYKPGSWGHFYEKLDNALRKAAARGIQVRMIVSDWNTRKYDIPHLKSLQVLPNIEVRISSIPEYSGGFIPYSRVEHCKYMIVDSDQIWLGTSNWSWSYFHNSRNLGLVLTNQKVNQTVHDIFQKSWNSPYCQTIDICREYIPPVISGEEN